jgi:hypothetical protein
MIYLKETSEAQDFGVVFSFVVGIHGCMPRLDDVL